MSRSTAYPSRPFHSAAKAFKWLKRRFGPPQYEFLYTDADDQPVGVALLWDEGGEGQRRQTIARHKDRWVIGEMPPPRPLYRTRPLAECGRIFLVATELEADRLHCHSLIFGLAVWALAPVSPRKPWLAPKRLNALTCDLRVLCGRRIELPKGGRPPRNVRSLRRQGRFG